TRLRWLAATAAVALAAGAVHAQAVQGVTDTEILLGSIQDMSGPVASVGAPMRDGMILAAEEINASGGINGRKIRLQIEDSGYDPKRGVLAAQKLISQDKVFAVLTVLGSAVVQATQPLVVNRGLPYLFPLASTEISYLPHSPLKFGAYALSSVHMRTAVEYAYAKLGKRRFGILYQDDETGIASLRAVEEQLKVHDLKLLASTSYKRGETNFASQIALLKAANVDIVILATVVRETAAAAVEARKQGWNVDMFVNQGTVNAVLALGGKAVEGLYGTTQYINSIDTAPGYLAFDHRFKTKFGRDAGDGANFGYAMIKLFAEGAKNAGRNLTPLTLAKGLENVKNYDTGFTTARYSYSADNHAPPREANILQVRDGKWVPVTGPTVVYDKPIK
ncbi:MAG: ABC transporter substrate-binding protein, partial [Sulfuricaulis sp.]|nr:ABC transporter substrate-binding protein [Sulfuricaulis sp.]